MNFRNDTLYTFEVIPRYATRKVYDKVLLPDTFAHEKKMTRRQVLAALNTCNLINVSYNNKWYPINLDTIDDVLDAIDANTEPTVADVEPMERSISSYVVIPEPDVEILGKKVSEFGNVKIENGNLSGYLNFIKDFTAFNGSNVNEQNGYYLPLGWTTNTKYTNPTMCVVNGSNKVVNMDEDNLIFLGSNQDVAFKKIIAIAADVDGEKATVSVRLKATTYNDNTVPDYFVGVEEEVVTPPEEDPVTPDPVPTEKPEVDPEPVG